MNICLLQTDLDWEDKSLNIKRFNSLIEKITQPVDLILLPEMFATGFTMNAQAQAETMEGPTIRWMQEQASETGAMLAGSLIIKEGNSFYNRFVAVSPTEIAASYDKRHLFRMGNEESHYKPGNERIIFEYRGWRILPQICYDLRFPVWMRNRGDYDLLLVVASWPEPRREVWTTLLKARAIENQVYVAAINRVGMDNKGINHAGDSQIISPKGAVMRDLGHDTATSITSISLDELLQFRAKFPVDLDRDDFNILI